MYVSHRTADERDVTANLTDLGIFDAVELLLSERLNGEKTTSLAVLVTITQNGPGRVGQNGWKVLDIDVGVQALRIGYMSRRWILADETSNARIVPA